MSPRETGYTAWCGTYYLNRSGTDGTVVPEDWTADAVWQSIVTQSERGVGQLERCPKTGRIHIQFYFEMKSRTRLGSLKQRFGQEAHFEHRRGSQRAAAQYCLKDDSKVEGTERFSWGNIRTVFPPKARPVRRHLVKDLYGWQTEVYEKEKFGDYCDPDWRGIVYVYSEFGAVGKSRFALTLVDQLEWNWIMVCGGVKDITYLVSEWYKNPENKDQELHGVIIDVPRACSYKAGKAWFSITAIESLINGACVSVKYESSSRRINRPHILVCANAEPPISEMSSDRWHLYCLGKNGRIAPELCVRVPEE